MEIINTEITYVNALKLIDSLFYQPSASVVNKKSLNDIFSNFYTF